MCVYVRRNYRKSRQQHVIPGYVVETEHIVESIHTKTVTKLYGVCITEQKADMYIAAFLWKIA